MQRIISKKEIVEQLREKYDLPGVYSIQKRENNRYFEFYIYATSVDEFKFIEHPISRDVAIPDEDDHEEVDE